MYDVDDIDGADDTVKILILILSHHLILMLLTDHRQSLILLGYTME